MTTTPNASPRSLRELYHNHMLLVDSRGGTRAMISEDPIWLAVSSTHTVRPGEICYGGVSSWV